MEAGSAERKWRETSPAERAEREWSGEGGIRTLGGLPHTRFPVVPIRPLSHPSGAHRVTSRRGRVVGCGSWVLRNGIP